MLNRKVGKSLCEKMSGHGKMKITTQNSLEISYEDLPVFLFRVVTGDAALAWLLIQVSK